jgi:hypothetical protein
MDVDDAPPMNGNQRPENPDSDDEDSDEEAGSNRVINGGLRTFPMPRSSRSSIISREIIATPAQTSQCIFRL